MVPPGCERRPHRRGAPGNTEYPWVNAGSSFAPTAAADFGDITKTKAWVETATRVSSALHKLDRR